MKWSTIKGSSSTIFNRLKAMELRVWKGIVDEESCDSQYKRVQMIWLVRDAVLKSRVLPN